MESIESLTSTTRNSIVKINWRLNANMKSLRINMFVETAGSVVGFPTILLVPTANLPTRRKRCHKSSARSHLSHYGQAALCFSRGRSRPPPGGWQQWGARWPGERFAAHAGGRGQPILLPPRDLWSVFIGGWAEYCFAIVSRQHRLWLFTYVNFYGWFQLSWDAISGFAAGYATLCQLTIRFCAREELSRFRWPAFYLLLNLNQRKSTDSQCISTHFQSKQDYWSESVVRIWLRVSRFLQILFFRVIEAAYPDSCNGSGFVSLVAYFTNAYCIRVLWVAYFSSSMGGI